MLLIAFGALVASAVPVLLAATAVVAAFGLLGPISQAFALDNSVKTVVLLIGMAVGVDYALFYVVRFREERQRGLGTSEALERTAATVGRSVLVAGLTVMIAMSGQFIVGSNIFNGIASGTIAVVACAVAGSVTVLPAVLKLLGPRIDRGRLAFLPHMRSGHDSELWGAIAGLVLRRPVLSVALAGGALVALADAGASDACRRAELVRALGARPVGARRSGHLAVPRCVRPGRGGRHVSARGACRGRGRRPAADG